MRESPHIPGTNEYEVSNFRNAPFGLIVTYSDHWYREHCQKKPKNPKLGIVTTLDFFQDSKGRVICWPNVYWEGEVMSSLCHPMNVVAYRKKQTLPMKTMDDGQWGTNGPPPPDPPDWQV